MLRNLRAHFVAPLNDSTRRKSGHVDLEQVKNNYCKRAYIGSFCSICTISTVMTLNYFMQKTFFQYMCIYVFEQILLYKNQSCIVAKGHHKYKKDMNLDLTCIINNPMIVVLLLSNQLIAPCNQSIIFFGEIFFQIQ